MSSLLVFNRVYRLEIQSVMLVFSTTLVNCCPSNLLSELPQPSPTSQSKRTVYTGSVWGDVELCCRPYSIFCRSLTLCFWPDSEPTKLLHHPKQKWPRKTTFRDWWFQSSFVHGHTTLAEGRGGVGPHKDDSKKWGAIFPYILSLQLRRLESCC